MAIESKNMKKHEKEKTNANKPKWKSILIYAYMTYFKKHCLFQWMEEKNEILPEKEIQGSL